MDFLPGADVSVRVMFEAFGQPRVPDAGTVSYNLRNDTGSIVFADEPLSPAAASNYVLVTVPSVYNGLGEGFRYEKRTIITKFSVAGVAYTVSTRYLLVPFLNMDIGPENVRKFVGVNARELADDEIDLTRAYFDIEATVTQAVLETALAGTPIQRKAANDAILCTAVIESMPSLKLRVAQSETDGPLGFQRFRDTPDFDQLRKDAIDLRSIALDTLTGRAGTAHPLITVSTPTDVITGA
jgi:hypothetical protein